MAAILPMATALPCGSLLPGAAAAVYLVRCLIGTAPQKTREQQLQCDYTHITGIRLHLWDRQAFIVCKKFKILKIRVFQLGNGSLGTVGRYSV